MLLPLLYGAAIVLICRCGATSPEATRHYPRALLFSRTEGTPAHRQPCGRYHLPRIVQIVSYDYIICVRTYSSSVTALTPFCVTCGVVSLIGAAVVLHVQQ